LAPKIIYYNDTGNNFIKTDDFRCHFFGQVYYFDSLYGSIPEKFVKCTDKDGCKNAQIAYEDVLRTSKQQIIAFEPPKVRELIKNVQLLQI
jgi:hypothetical protein